MDVAPAGMDEPDDGDELGHLQGTRANTVAFGVCNLLFMNAIFFGGGLPVSNKER